MTLGEKLSKLRKENNYTQEQLADILGISRQSISKWESDIAYPETDKLIELGKMLGIDKEQIMVCGDGLNDYEMIEKCGFGVAMENGNPKVKAIADYVTASNNEDGVGKAVAKFVLK